MISGFYRDNREPLLWEIDPELWAMYQQSMRDPTYNLGKLNDRWAAKYDPDSPDDDYFEEFDDFESDGFYGF